MKHNYHVMNSKRPIIKKTKLQWILMFLVGSMFSLTIQSQTIGYSFENAIITNDGANTFYEVDIMFSTDTDLQLGSGQFYLNYNTAAFGSNVDASGTVTFAHPAAPAVGDPEYLLDGDAFDAISLYTVVVNDNTTSRVSFAYVQAQNGAFFPTVTSAGSPHKLAHVKIQYVDVNEDPMISFDALGDNQTFTAGTTATSGDGTQITNDSFDSNNTTPANVWTGSMDGDFSTAGNWSANLAPVATQKVMIPSGLSTYPTASGDITVSEMVIQSGASFIAQGMVTGNVIYNRTLETSNWYLVGAPVVGQDEDDFVNDNNLESSIANPGNRALGIYNTATDDWNYYNSSTGAATLTSGTGYAINLEATSGNVAFSGSMLTTDLSPIALATTGSGFNLVGNPYPSYLNSADVLVNSTAALETQTLWVWDQSANMGVGAYEPKVTADAFQVAPGQGFFVQADSDGGNVMITENEQSHQSTDTFLRTSNTRPEIHLNMSSTSFSSMTKIYYIDGTTTSFDNGFDGPLFQGGDNSFAIYTHLVSNGMGTDYDLQSLPINNYENMIIPIGVNAEGGQISFSASLMNLPNDLNVYIEDKENNSFTLLTNSNDSYDATLGSSYSGIGRFYLHTTTSTLSSGEDLFGLNHVSVYPVDSARLMVTGINNEDANMEVYNLLGQQVFATSFIGNGNNEVRIPSFKSAVYIVNITTQKGKKSAKVVIE